MASYYSKIDRGGGYLEGAGRDVDATKTQRNSRNLAEFREGKKFLDEQFLPAIQKFVNNLGKELQITLPDHKNPRGTGFEVTIISIEIVTIKRHERKYSVCELTVKNSQGEIKQFSISPVELGKRLGLLEIDDHRELGWTKAGLEFRDY